MLALRAAASIIRRPIRLRVLASVRRATLPVPSWTHKRDPALEIVRLEVSRFDPRTGRLPIEFRFFVLRHGRVLDRFDEVHVVQTHDRDEMRTLLRRSGFDLAGAFAATN